MGMHGGDARGEGGMAAEDDAAESAAIRPVSLEVLASFAARRWRPIFASAFAGAIALVAASFLIVPAYRATVLVTPVNNDLASAARGAVGGQLGGLAALAGVNLGGGDTKEEYLAFLQSRDFVAGFVRERDLVPVLFAPRWSGALAFMNAEDPTLQDAVRRFRNDVYSVDEDRKTRIVTITVTWTDKATAARWANELVDAVNDRLRARAIRESESNLAYLRQQLAQQNVLALEQALGRLIETELRTAMLARGRPQYAFKVIDPAVVPDDHDKVRPRRALMGAFGFFLGGSFAALVALVRARRDVLRARGA
jgi:uncharacterized protein involved in exopolysaccharide biosynthesis